MILADLIAPVFKILEKLIPDPAARAAAQLELLKLQQAGEFKELDTDLARITAQTDTNKAEAASASLFVAGWRPAMGWCCVLIFAANYVGVPLLAWVAAIRGWPAPARLDMGEVLPVLLGMLGLGTLRTVDKIKGTAP